MHFKENICEKSDIQMEDAVINMSKYINLLSFTISYLNLVHTKFVCSLTFIPKSYSERNSHSLKI